MILKKICTRFGFFVRESSSDPLSPSGILKIPRATRRALGPPLRPPFVASLLSPAFAPALGPGGLPSGFSKSPPGFGGSERRFPPKNPNLLYKFSRRQNVQIIVLNFKFTQEFVCNSKISWLKSELSATRFTSHVPRWTPKIQAGGSWTWARKPHEAKI